MSTVITMNKEKVEDLNKDPYFGINFVPRKAEIISAEKKLLFSETVSFPDYYTDNSVNIVSSKYLCNTAKRKESSIKDMLDRVSEELGNWGFKDGYFENEEEKNKFIYKLKYYQIRQYFSFNSPVYFNVGLLEKPQCSACFIIEIEDNMESIFEAEKTESVIFKWGSGSGMNLSSLRSSKEKVRGGGFASGPISFLKAHDIAAGVIKSGGTLRRSAKFAGLNVDHPDIEEFIICKRKEESKLKILRDGGFIPDDGTDLSDHAFFQNTNISVRVTDEFMKRVENDEDWWTKTVTTKENYKKYKARDLLWKVAEMAWDIADPGIQFHDTMNSWHTCPKGGTINSTNPCGEYAFLDNSSCNLASLNLTKFFKKNSTNGNIFFDIAEFKDVVNTVLIAQDIIIDNALYPTKKISKNSHDYRPLGLGYTNLGAALMWLGLPYDSIEARTLSSAITALLTAEAYKTSSIIAKKKGPFEKFEENKEYFYKILDKHYEYVSNLLTKNVNNKEITQTLLDYAGESWNELIKNRKESSPFRNAQVTLLAPTGTISFFMGCDTTGIEPELSLVKYKVLSGQNGATIKIVNNIVKEALENLGYSSDQSDEFISILKEEGHLENSKLDRDHLAIFDTSMAHSSGKRIIDYMAHLKMLAAVQPFVSGGISKTINLPGSVSVQEIFDLYIKAWKMGLKGVTVYRDGSKTFQPLKTNNRKVEMGDCSICNKTSRKRLPDERSALTHKFYINQTEGYLTCGYYEDGKLGEIFINIAKEGSSMSGMLDSLATVTSIAIQHQVPLKNLVKKMMFTRFEPAGITKNENIRFTTSIVDYIFRYIGMKFLSEEEKTEIGLTSKNKEDEVIFNEITTSSPAYTEISYSAPVCEFCGSMMQRKGTCYVCINCGDNTGSCS
jgi:ribonucleoside-diphosphate reductase alpha chain